MIEFDDPALGAGQPADEPCPELIPPWNMPPRADRLARLRPKRGRAVIISVAAHLVVAGLVVLLAVGWKPAKLEPGPLDTRIGAAEVDYEVALVEPAVIRPLAPVPSAPEREAATPPPVAATASAIAPNAAESHEGSPHTPCAEPGTRSVPATLGRSKFAAPIGAPAGAAESGGAATAFFQVPGRGEAIVYVIDRSASMGMEGRLSVARRELLASLERLPATARFQVIVYNRSAEPLRLGGRPELLAATPENKQAAARFLETLVAEGGTDHLPALRAALALLPDVVYFLTDADDLKADQVRALTVLNRGRTAIHTIELNTLNRDRAQMPLHVLARDNRGVYQPVEVKSWR